MPKINISLPDDLLEALDKAAREAHSSRSAFLAQAVTHLLEDMESEKRVKRQRQAANAIDRLREEFGDWNGTSEILKWHNMH